MKEWFFVVIGIVSFFFSFWVLGFILRIIKEIFIAGWEAMDQ